jgi:hypothetical protein
MVILPTELHKFSFKLGADISEHTLKEVQMYHLKAVPSIFSDEDQVGV